MIALIFIDFHFQFVMEGLTDEEEEEGLGIFKIFFLFEFVFLVLSFYKFCCKYHIF